MPPSRKPPPRPSGRPNRSLLLAAVAAAAVVAALVVASLAFRDGDSDADTSTPTVPAAVGTLFDGIAQDRAVLGSPDAKVTLIQFEDLQCPICKRYQEEALPAIVEQYVRTGRIKLRFAGIAFIGPDSKKALHYVLAAGAQGKLWQLADALYENQGGENDGWVTESLVEALSNQLGLEFAKLQSDADGPAVNQQASSMAAEAEQRQVPGTPWFYVQVGNGAPYEVRPSSFDIGAFASILDDALAG